MKESMRYSALFLVLAMAACGGEGGEPAADDAQAPAVESTPAPADAAPMEGLPDGVTPAMVAEGETIFNGSTGICWSCHMEGGAGGPNGPNLTDAEWINIDGSYEAIVQNVITGVPEPQQHPGIMLPRAGMPLTDEQVAAVAAYVWTLSQGG